MTAQEELIGSHPNTDSFISNWLTCEDVASIEGKKHRSLNEINSSRQTACEEIGKWLLINHVSEKKLKRLQRKKEILDKHELQSYMQAQYPFPTNKSTKKGNYAEVLFSEYLQQTSGLHAFVYKLHYTRNVEQAMKGDDCLLFDKVNLSEKILVGEAKFRKSPSKKAVLDILLNLEGQKRLPLSLSFVANCLSEADREDEAEQIKDLLAEIHEGKIPIINAGFLLSSSSTTPSKDTFATVEKHFKSSNQKLVFVSLGMELPDSLVEESFKYATELYYDTPSDLIEEFTKAE